MICPVCHNNNLRTVYQNTAFQTKRNVLQCEACTTYMLFPLPNIYELNEYYKKHYSRLDYKRLNINPITKMKLLYADMRAASQLRFIKKHIPGLAGKNVVDFGCSTGNLLKLLKNEGCMTLGVELDRQGSDFATRTYDLRILRIPIENAIEEIQTPMDLIIFSHSLEHLLDPIETLSRCYDLLKPDGHLFIELPNSYVGPKNGLKWDEFCDILLDSDHIYNFSYQNIGCLVSCCKFAVREKQIFLSHRMFPLLESCRLNAVVDHVLKKRTERLKRYVSIALNTIYLVYLFLRRQETVEFICSGKPWVGTNEWMRILVRK